MQMLTCIIFCSVYRGYVGIHSSGFRDFLLKPELLRAIVDSGFEHPSEGKMHFFAFGKICGQSHFFSRCSDRK